MNLKETQTLRENRLLKISKELHSTPCASALYTDTSVFDYAQACSQSHWDVTYGYSSGAPCACGTDPRPCLVKFNLAVRLGRDHLRSNPRGEQGGPQLLT